MYNHYVITLLVKSRNSKAITEILDSCLQSHLFHPLFYKTFNDLTI